MVGCGFLENEPPKQGVEEKPGWTSLFDGKTLDGWEKTNFGGEGPVSIREGNIELSFGEMLTGITWTRDFPKTQGRTEAATGSNRLCRSIFPGKAPGN